MIGVIVGVIVFYKHLGFEMIIKLEDLSREELIEALSKAMKQISKLVDENKELKEKLNERL